MTAKIVAIPTRYAGVNFRSRLEARWAAFFNLGGFIWEYEPCDFAGWIPDFRLDFDRRQGSKVEVFVEVKPCEPEVANSRSKAPDIYGKAIQHEFDMNILLLGSRPRCIGRNISNCHIGSLLFYPDGQEHCGWHELNNIIGSWRIPEEGTIHDAFWLPTVVSRAGDLWREAGNLVQWRAPE